MTSEVAAKRLLTGQAWDDFCETLRRTGHEIDKWGGEPNELDRTEWYRYLSRVLRNGLERFVENCEPDRPRLRDVPFRFSVNATCPDQDHLLTEWFDGSHDYRVFGNRGTVHYFVMAAWRANQPSTVGERDWAQLGTKGLEEFDPAMLYTTSFLNSNEIDFDIEGNFEVIVSREKPADNRNWLPINEDTVGLLIRVVHRDRSNEVSPTMHIERLDKPTPRPVQPGELASNLAKAAQMVLGYAELPRAWWFDNLSQRKNQLQFSRNVYLSNGGVADRHHAFGAWEKPATHALVLEFETPPCEYWIFQLLNIWQENLDTYEDGGGYVTIANAKHEPDGSVRIVIAEEDPAIGGNWIDSFGHTHGTMSLRFIQTEVPPSVKAYLVSLADLKANGSAALKAAAAIQSGELVA